MERRWIKIHAGKAIGVASIVGLFILFSVLYNFQITDLTGDIVCEGTYDNPCISEFEVKNPNAFVVDVYSKDQVKLDFSPEIYDYALFVPDGRCSATGSCACILKDGRKLGFEDWRCVDFTNATKPRKDKEYNFRFDRYYTTTFRIAGIKNNPEDDIKWTFGVNEKELDPIWEGVKKEKDKEKDKKFNPLENHWKVEKKLIQTEVDKNYPCHIEDENEIVCPALTNDQISKWKESIEKLPLGEKDKGRLSDLEKMNKLENKKTLYSGNLEKEIDLTQDYREKIDVYNQKENIEIGFSTNYFSISGAPYENFDVDVDAGIVKFNPINDTWLYSTNAYIGGALDGMQAQRYGTIGIWIKALSSTTSKRVIYCAVSSKSQLSLINSSLLYANVVNSTSGSIELSYNFDFNDGIWHYIAYTYTTNNFSIYIDGQVVNYTEEIINTGSTLAGTSYLFGQCSAGASGTNPYDYDELRGYDVGSTSTGLNLPSDSEILEIYNAGRRPNTTLNSFGDLEEWITSRQGGRESNTNIYNRVDDTQYTVSNSLYRQDDGINISTVDSLINITIADMTNAYVRWDNGTVLLDSLDVNGRGNYTGDATFTFLENQSIYIDDYYNFTYEVQITDPTEINPVEVSSGDNITIKFNFLENGENITSGVSINNITIGGTEASVIGDAGEEKVDTACDEGSYASRIEAYSNWTISGSGTTTVTGFYFYQKDTTMGEGESFNIRFYDAGGTAVAGSDNTIYGTGANEWAYIAYETPFEITLGESYIVGMALPGTFNVGRDTSSNCAGYLPNQGTWYVSPGDSSLDASVPFGSQSSYKYVIIGISYGENEFAFIDGSGWNVNVTVPEFEQGLKDLFVDAFYNPIFANSTEVDAIDYGSPPDITPPYFTSIENQTIYVNESLSYDIDAEDEIEFDSFAIDDTTNFSIVAATGVITNSTSLEVGHYTVNVTINDTSNNLNSSLWGLDVLALPVSSIDLEIIVPSDLGQDQNVTQNSFFNITVNVTCHTVNCGDINVSLDPIPTGAPVREITDESSLALIERNRYIIEFDKDPLVKTELKIPIIKDIYKSIRTNSIKNEQEDFVSSVEKKLDYKLKVVRKYNYVMNGIVVEIEDKDVDKLKGLGAKNIWKDELMHIDLQDSVPLINAPDVWSYQNDTGSNITGEGVIVAVIDTGIYYNHPDFGSCDNDMILNGTCPRIAYGWDFLNDDNDPLDDHAHGTHVSGIIGASGGITGVAPNVTFYEYKVCNFAGSCPTSDVIAAIENATAFGVDIISMSLGSLGPVNNEYNTAIQNAVEAGVLVIASIGNDGPGLFTAGYPGNDPYGFSVGNIYKNGVLSSSSSRGFSLIEEDGVYSRYGIEPDVVSYGSYINSTVPLEGATYGSSTGYRIFSGTSMSAPHVSGVAALIKQANPDWTPAQIRSVIANSAEDLGYLSIEQGTGKVDALISFNTTSAIDPINLFMGNCINETGTWESSKMLNLINLGDETLNYNLSIDFSASGVTPNLTTFNITLGAGENYDFNLSLSAVLSSVESNDYLGEVIVNVSNGQILRIPFAVYFEVFVKGLVPTIEGSKPFWTNESNPRTINLDAGESELVTFWVEPTGNIGEKFTFFVFANMTSNESIGNISEEWNVSIQAPPSEYPIFSDIWDNNGSLIYTGTALFNATILNTNHTAGIEFDGINYSSSVDSWVDGTHLYQTLTAINQHGSDLLVSMWFKTSVPDDVIIWHGNHFEIILTNGTEIFSQVQNYWRDDEVNYTWRRRFMNMTTEAPYELNDSQWHHIAFHWDNNLTTGGLGNLSLYLDGAVINSTTPEGLNTTLLRWVGSTMFVGWTDGLSVDEVRIYYDKCLSYCEPEIDITPDDIMDIYNSGRINNPNLIPDQDDMPMWFWMDEKQGSYVYNRAPNATDFQNNQYYPFFYPGYDNDWGGGNTHNVNFEVTGTGTYPYYWWAYGEEGDTFNTTETLYYTVNESCPYTSGDWNIAASDECIISADRDIGGNNIYCTGTGTFEVLDGVKITNWNYRKFDEGCYYIAHGDGGFYQW